MIERIECRIAKHIEYILDKEELDYPDYLILTSEISRLEQKSHTIDWGGNFASLLACGFAPKTKEEN